MNIAPWSFSKAKAFEQCPKQFYHEKILKQYPVKETDAMRYGTDFHKACEDYIKSEVPLPKKFDFIQSSPNTPLSLIHISEPTRPY